MDEKCDNFDAGSDSKALGAKEVDLEGDKQGVMELVMQFATGSDFEKDFEDFAEAHSKTFLPVLELKAGEEHPLEWHDVYLEYLRTFEGKIERFIESSGYKIHDFYEQAKQILEDIDTFGETRFFLEALLATAEYETFIILMKGEMFTRFAPKKDEALDEAEYDPDCKTEESEEKSDAKN